jgi:1,4-dihydroxy-2-naphthoyl-CoA hydrolase
MALDAHDLNSWLRLQRTVRFGDTDAAGVMHFHQLLRWCHEAWEESLERFGIPAAEVFPMPGAVPGIALPIVHCSADYFHPLVCGDDLVITMQPQLINPGRFEVVYLFTKPKIDVAQGLTRHLAIDKANGARCDLPAGIYRWLQASEGVLIES